jgi:hypothetical protein
MTRSPFDPGRALEAQPLIPFALDLSDPTHRAAAARSADWVQQHPPLDLAIGPDDRQRARELALEAELKRRHYQLPDWWPGNRDASGRMRSQPLSVHRRRAAA